MHENIRIIIQFFTVLHCVHIRVVAMGSEKKIGPHNFINWGSHSDVYPCAYFTAAAAIGMKKEEIDTYLKKLDKVFTKFKQSKTNET